MSQLPIVDAAQCGALILKHDRGALAYLDSGSIFKIEPNYKESIHGGSYLNKSFTVVHFFTIYLITESLRIESLQRNNLWCRFAGKQW